jgi:N-acetylneuraminate synthase
MRDWQDPFAPGGTGPLIIAEVGQAHDGSLGTAHAYIDAAARAGADAVKFQTHLAHAESTRDEPWRVAFSPQDASRYEYWERMAFTPTQWAGLRRHAAEVGLGFVSSPFSLEAVSLLADVGVDALKIASGEVANLELVTACADTGRPTLLSSGMSPLAELDEAVDRVRSAGVPYAVLQCTSSYPCPVEEVGLNVLAEFRARWDCPVGLSDHTGTIYPGLAAATLGADVVEVHVTMSREGYGPDGSSSVTTDELRRLCEGTRSIARMLEHPVDKDRAAVEREELRTIFGRSLVARTTLPAGHLLTEADLIAKKPGGGVPPGGRDALIGRRLRRALAADQRILPDDVEPTPGGRADRRCDP